MRQLHSAIMSNARPQPANPMTNDASSMSENVGHVVVVDDDASLRQMLTRFLQEHSVSVKAASGRVELNRHLLDGEPGLIILDLRLGQDDGLDLLRDIRANSDVPVI